MATRKRGTSVRGLGELSIREYRSGLAKLKAAGLISDKVDVRRHEPTRHMRDQLRKFSDIVRGTAKSIKVGRSDARDFSITHRTKNGRVIVEAKKTDKVTYSSREKEIRLTISPVRGTGAKVKAYIRPRDDPSKLPDLGPNQKYILALRRGNVLQIMEFARRSDVEFYFNRAAGQSGQAWMLPRVMIADEDARLEGYGEDSEEDEE